jgi:hypothetical protein
MRRRGLARLAMIMLSSSVLPASCKASPNHMLVSPLGLEPTQYSIHTSVFVDGEQAPGLPLGWTYGFMIPILVETPSKALLALAQAYLKPPQNMTTRAKDEAHLRLGDGEHIWVDIVCKRSEDGGHSWGPLTLSSRASSLVPRVIHSWSQPLAIVDR